MRGVLGLRVPVRLPEAPDAPSLSRCAGVTASWVSYPGAVRYDLQWGTSVSGSIVGGMTLTTITDATSPRLVVGYDAQASGLYYAVRIRAILDNGTPTPWSAWAVTFKAEPPPPPTASLTGGLAITIAAPGAVSGDLHEATAYDAEMQFAAGVAPPASEGGWSNLTSWSNVAATLSTTYFSQATGWYRARIRYRGLKCSDAWVGAWGAWSSAVYAGPQQGGGGGEVGGN